MVKRTKRVLARISINRKVASIAEASKIVKEANKARDDAKKMQRNAMMIKLTKLIQ